VKRAYGGEAGQTKPSPSAWRSMEIISSARISQIKHKLAFRRHDEKDEKGDSGWLSPFPPITIFTCPTFITRSARQPPEKVLPKPP
jgi:hypothetical protein